MLEPQGTALFVLLIVVFGALMWRALVTRRVVFRVLAVCLGFPSCHVVRSAGGQ